MGCQDFKVGGTKLERSMPHPDNKIIDEKMKECLETSFLFTHSYQDFNIAGADTRLTNKMPINCGP